MVVFLMWDGSVIGKGSSVFSVGWKCDREG